MLAACKQLYRATVTAMPEALVAPVQTPSPSGDVAEQMAQLAHTFSRFRAAVANATEGGDWIGNQLLFQILRHGPMRSGELAQYTHADPSTVSRQVAMLVRDGMVERRADPLDGRAILLHATEAGRRRHGTHLITRERYYRQMLHTWTQPEQELFAALLHRFVADFDDYLPTLLADIVHAAAQQAASVNAATLAAAQPGTEPPPSESSNPPLHRKEPQ